MEKQRNSNAAAEIDAMDKLSREIDACVERALKTAPWKGMKTKRASNLLGGVLALRAVWLLRSRGTTRDEFIDHMATQWDLGVGTYVAELEARPEWRP